MEQGMTFDVSKLLAERPLFDQNWTLHEKLADGSANGQPLTFDGSR